jgi:hypothetical protein
MRQSSFFLSFGLPINSLALSWSEKLSVESDLSLERLRMLDCAASKMTPAMRKSQQVSVKGRR